MFNNIEQAKVLPMRTSARATYSLSASTSATNKEINNSANIIRVFADGQNVYLKYGTGVTTSDNGFDEIIPSGQICDFAIPNNTTDISVITLNGTANVIVIEK